LGEDVGGDNLLRILKGEKEKLGAIRCGKGKTEKSKGKKKVSDLLGETLGWEATVLSRF